MTMNYETQLAAMEQELARQDAELAIAREQLGALGDCELGIAAEILRQIDDACVVHVSTSLPIHNGLRA
jgi:hypothetical protein